MKLNLQSIKLNLNGDVYWSKKVWLSLAFENFNKMWDKDCL